MFEKLAARWTVWRVRQVERACMRVANLIPRSMVYWAGVRILSEVTARRRLSHVGREVAQGEIRMLYALQEFANRRP